MTVRDFPSYAGIDMVGLSTKRRQALQVLKGMVPSTEGDPRFERMQSHAACVARRKENPAFTTCGALPAWYFKQLGVNRALANYGLSGLRDAAIQLRCWRSNDAQHGLGTDQRPLPGDVYVLCTQRFDIEIAHVGVIVNASGNQWWTADAGQGAKEMQQALYVKRQWQPHSRLLEGENYGRMTGRPPRRLIGWVDLDAAFSGA